MQQAGQDVLRLGYGPHIRAVDVQAVNVQLDLAHCLHGGAKGGDVVLEVDKGAGDAVGILGKLFQLGCQGLRSGDFVGFLAGVGSGFIHNFIQPAAFQGHRLNHLRVHLVQVVVAEGIRVHTG